MDVPVGVEDDSTKLLATGKRLEDSRGECAKMERRKRVGWKPVALDGGYGWVVVLGSFLIHVFADGFVYSFGVVAESLIKEFNASNTEVSTVLSLLTGLMLAAGPLASAICNRIGCRTTTIIGALIAAVGCFASYYATSMHYLIGSVGIVMGLGFGLMYCPAIVIVTIYFEKRRSLATGITVCGAGVGTFLFSNIIGHLIAHFGWRQVFIIYAGLVLLCVPCGALYRPIQFHPIYEDDDREEEEGELKGDGQKPQRLDANAPLPTANGAPLTHHHIDSAHQANISPAPPTCGGSGRESLLRPGGQRFTFHHPLREAQSSQVLSPKSSGKSTAGPVDSPQSGGGGGVGVLQRFRSLGEHLHLRSSGLPMPDQTGASNAAGEDISISTGYLNVKDVFYQHSIVDLPGYAENERRFRSVSSLSQTAPHHHHRHPNASGGSGAARATGDSKDPLKPNRLTDSATHLHAVEKIEEREEEEFLDDEENDLKGKPSSSRDGYDEEEDSGASSASRAIEVWSSSTTGPESESSPLVSTKRPCCYGSLCHCRHEGGGNTHLKHHVAESLIYRFSHKLLRLLRTVKRMMDLGLLADPVYLLFAVSNFFTSIGFNAPPMFMPMNAEKVLGFGVEQAAATVAAYGLANSFGRIAFGVLCDRRLPTKWGKDRGRNRLWIYNLTLMLCGLASCFVFTLQGLHAFIAYCFFFGFTISSYVCLTSVVLVDLIGVDRLTNAFGLLLFIQGLATFVGPPIAGSLYDVTLRYDWTFVFCGICLFVSGAMLFAIPYIQQRRQRRLRLHKGGASNGDVLLALHHDGELEEPVKVKRTLEGVPVP